MITSVTITGGTHGNETNGVELAKHLLRTPTFTARPSFKTRVLLTNPAAVEKNVRYVDEDLNRCFAQALLDDDSRGSTEAVRARALNAVLGPKGSAAPATDLIIDLHNTTAATGVCLLTAPDDALCLGLAASLIEADPAVVLATWQERPRAECAPPPTVARLIVTFVVKKGAPYAPWQSIDTRCCIRLRI
jgi:succinylglutamate desuccinylase